MDPERLLELSTGRLKASRSELREALRGHVTTHHGFLLKLHLEQIASIETAITTIDQEVGHGLDPFRAQVARLLTIPGVGDLMARSSSPRSPPERRSPDLLGRLVPAQR